VKNTYYVVAAMMLMLGCSRGIYDRGRADGDGTSGKTDHSSDTSWERTDNKDQNLNALRRLESVKWDSVKHELTWDVSRGEKKGDAYHAHSSDHYQINMDRATMTVNGETRRFSGEEAANVRTLMDFISKYALESTVWWENGEGEPLGGKGAPTKPGRTVPARPPDIQDNPDGNTRPIHIAEVLSAVE